MTQSLLVSRQLPPVDDRTLRDLDFARIREAVSERAQTEVGRARCRDLPLLPTTDAVQDALRAVGELMLAFKEAGLPSLGGIYPIDEAVQLAERGGVLEGRVLQDIGTTLSQGEKAANWCVARREVAPAVAAMLDAFGDYDVIVKEIEKSFEPNGRLSDDASPALGELRRKVQGLREALTAKMEELVKDFDAEGLLQDKYHTLREERFVLPVKANERWRVDGIVHDTSQTHQTFFIEPRAVVDLGNRLKMAQADVQEEELRILKALSHRVGRRAKEIVQDLEALHQLDVAVARARLGQDLECNLPTLLDLDGKPEVYLRSFKHPVLTLDQLAKGSKPRVIANDLFVGNPRVLVITGPNTGGKTVALKGVGLSVLMVRAGLAIPAGPESRIPVYDRIYSVVGDGQSLAEGLSSFGAHLRSVGRMLEGVQRAAAAGQGTLCLLDEVMAGTDPEQGAALAQALLESLAKEGAHVVATTHFEKLKALPLQPEGEGVFRNASVGLNPSSLSPTYKLVYDTPGASSALDMAIQLGLPSSIVERARSLSSEQGRRLDDVLRKLSEKQAAVEEERTRMEAERISLEKAREEAERRAAELRETERDVKRKAREGLLQETQRVRRELTEAVDRAKAALEKKHTQEAQEHLSRVGAIADRVAAAVEEDRREEAQQRSFDRPLSVGSKVHVVTLNVEGEVLELTAKDALVQSGVMRVRVALKDLAPPRKRHIPSGPAPVAVPSVVGGKQEEVDRSLDLRGERVDDALEKLGAFLDRAAQAEVDQLMVIHGHGTGALRKAIRDELKRSPLVDTFAAGSDDQGGNGVTVVTLHRR